MFSLIPINLFLFQLHDSADKGSHLNAVAVLSSWKQGLGGREPAAALRLGRGFEREEIQNDLYRDQRDESQRVDSTISGKTNQIGEPRL